MIQRFWELEVLIGVLKGNIAMWLFSHLRARKESKTVRKASKGFVHFFESAKFVSDNVTKFPTISAEGKKIRRQERLKQRF